MPIDLYLVFVMVSLVVMISPGPAVVLAITNGMLHGSRGACAGVFGNMTGFAILSSVSVAGLGALIAANGWLFDLLKWIGGLYLIYLGVMMWFSQRQRVGVNAQIDSVKSLHGFQLYKRGLVVTLSNPKAFVYVTALLPQFIDTDKPVLPQFLILILTMMTMQLIVLNGYAFLSGRVRDWLNAPGRMSLFNKTIGSTFIAFGVSLLFTNQKA